MKMIIKKYIFRILSLILTLLFLASAFVYWRLQQSLAPLDGELQLAGLEKPVRVVRDFYGIPHIYAENHRDGLRALGFTVASERIFQMEVVRRLVYGELAEVFGEPALISDKLFRSLMLRPAIERMISLEKKEGRFDQRIWEDMEAYFAGVNEYLKTQPQVFELQLIGVKPRPYTVLDAYMMAGYMSFGFAVPLKVTPLLSDLQKKLRPALINELRNKTSAVPLQASGRDFKDTGSPVGFSAELPASPLLLSSSLATLPSTAPLSPWRQLESLHASLSLPTLEGSNAWLISPRLSASGKSLFANDPHIAYSNPAVWFEAHLVTPDQEIYGHYMPLIPFPILGHTPKLAWGLTMSLTDDMDYYQETLDQENQTALFRNKPVPYRTWNEVIKVKGEADFLMNMIETSHGPLLDNVLDQKGLALKWLFLDSRNNPLKSLWRMGRATNMAEFEEALKGTTAPGLNVLYADSLNIAWWLFGDIILRSRQDSDLILDGASGRDEYLGIMNWKDKPYAVNPKEGYIVSANARPAGLTPEIRGDWQSDNRFETIRQELLKRPLWDVSQTKKLQTLNFNSQTPKMLQKMINCLVLTEAERATLAPEFHLLAQWNHHSELDAKAASFFHLWNNYNLQNLLAELDSDSREIYLNSAYSWQFYERQILQYPCDHPVGSGTDSRTTLASKLTAGFKSTAQDPNAKKPWGSVHTVEYGHPLGRVKPLNLIYNVGPHPAPGAYNEINNIKFRLYGTNFPSGAGPSTRRIIDMADTSVSWGINPLGVSGQLLSPYRTSEVQMYLRGQYREQLMSSERIERSKTHELTLKPPL